MTERPSSPARGNVPAKRREDTLKVAGATPADKPEENRPRTPEMSAAVMFRSALRPAVQAAGRRTAAATVCRQAPRMMSTYFTPGELPHVLAIAPSLIVACFFVGNGISL